MKSKILLVVLLITLCSSFVLSQIPQTINYQGVLTQPSGEPVANGDYSIIFKLYDADTGGSEQWTETQQVTINNGVFNVILGSITPLALNFNVPYWLSLKVGADPELVPRIELTGVPYSFNSINTVGIQNRPVDPGIPTNGQVLKWDGSTWAPADDNAGSTVWQTAGNNITYNQGRVGIGTVSPGHLLSVIQASGTSNVVHFESQAHVSGQDLLELVVPVGSPATSQIIEMQNGSTTVAAVNADGSARFKSMTFPDNTTQETSGPLAKAYLDAVSSVSTTVNVIGSTAMTATYNTIDNYIEVTLTGVSMTQSTHLVQVTPIRVNNLSATVDRSASVYFTGGKVQIYVWDQSVGGATFNDCFITIYEL